MAANDEVRQFTAAITQIGLAPIIVLPASPGVAWVLDSAQYSVFAAAPATAFYDGNLIVFDGVSPGGTQIWSEIWQFFTVAAGTTTFTSDSISITGPVRGTIGKAMTITSILVNGTLANTQQRLDVTGHIL